jgi:TcpE family
LKLVLDLPTYTKLFEVERKLYKIFDLELPRPVGLLETLAFILTLILIVLVMSLLGIGIGPNNAFLYVVPPGLAAWLASQQFDITDAKRPHVWAIAQLRYLLEPRHLVRLQPNREPRRLRIDRQYWQPLGADWLRRE